MIRQIIDGYERLRLESSVTTYGPDTTRYDMTMTRNGRPQQASVHAVAAAD